MDPLHLAIALFPLAVYLLVLGGINLSPRPYVVSGTRDALALALGLSGLVAVGPIELFLPERAASLFGGWVWLLMLGLYALCAIFVILMLRPRLVIYNVAVTELKPALEQVLKSIDPEASWADDTYVLPQLAVQFHLEAFPALRNISLSAIGTRQSWLGWRRLETELSAALRQSPGVSNPYGFTLVLMSLLLAGTSTYMLVTQRETLAQALKEMLRL